MKEGSSSINHSHLRFIFLFLRNTPYICGWEEVTLIWFCSVTLSCQPQAETFFKIVKYFVNLLLQSHSHDHHSKSLHNCHLHNNNYHDHHSLHNSWCCCVVECFSWTDVECCWCCAGASLQTWTTSYTGHHCTDQTCVIIICSSTDESCHHIQVTTLFNCLIIIVASSKCSMNSVLQFFP